MAWGSAAYPDISPSVLECNSVTCDSAPRHWTAADPPHPTGMHPQPRETYSQDGSASRRTLLSISSASDAQHLADHAACTAAAKVCALGSNAEQHCSALCNLSHGGSSSAALSHRTNQCTSGAIFRRSAGRSPSRLCPRDGVTHVLAQNAVLRQRISAPT